VIASRIGATSFLLNRYRKGAPIVPFRYFGAIVKATRLLDRDTSLVT
jgi:hypothetical protein